MHPKEQILADLKEAMKAGEVQRRNTLRLLSAAFKQAEVDERKELSAEDALKILKKEAKRREESITDLEKAGRDTSDEQAELDLISAYLPAEMDRAAIEQHAREAIAESGATSPKEMGDVMKILMPRLGGQADGKLVSEVVRGLLN
jgi:uncharacterized protein YqeY